MRLDVAIVEAITLCLCASLAMISLLRPILLLTAVLDRKRQNLLLFGSIKTVPPTIYRGSLTPPSLSVSLVTNSWCVAASWYQYWWWWNDFHCWRRSLSSVGARPRRTRRHHHRRHQRRRVGNTITENKRPCEKMLPGFKPVFRRRRRARQSASCVWILNFFRETAITTHLIFRMKTPESKHSENITQISRVAGGPWCPELSDTRIPHANQGRVRYRCELLSG